ncbi:MAG: RNA-directed DNA polymerase [Clostridia bacterium]|nr:RNA-directed DNA polymerase [Clostridia bacterium]
MLTITYEELFTYENLYKAHLRGRRGKRDKKPLVRFEMEMLGNLQTMYEKLHSGTYRMDRYHSFIVEEPKRREIQTLPYENRVVQHVLCDNLLAPYFTKRSILDNAACQEGKGMHFAMKRFEEKLREHIRKHGVNGYFLKCDILKYFPSVPHKKLKEVICSHIADEKIKKLLSDIIDGYHTKQAYLDKYGIPSEQAGANTGRGIPIGNQTSQIFGMFYLNDVDRLVKEKLRIRVYSRYMDDFILLHEDRKHVEYALSEMKKVVESLGLYFNSKTQLFPIKNGITYLGFRFHITPTGKIIKKVKKQSRKRLRWRSRLLKKAYLDGDISLERVKYSQAAFHGHLIHGNCYKFEQELNARLDFTKDKEKEE